MTAETDIPRPSDPAQGAATPSVASPSADGAPPDRQIAGRSGARLGLLLALILLGDWLFWNRYPGLSVALFAMAVAAGLLCASGRALPLRRQISILLLVGVSVLPAIEYAQALAIAFAGAGLLAALTLASGRALRLGALAWSLAWVPIQAPKDMVASFTAPTEAPARGATPRIVTALRAWALPGLLGGLFLGLFAIANPVIDGWLVAVTAIDWGNLLHLERAILWGLLAWLVWPCLVSQRLAPAGPKVPGLTQSRRDLLGPLVNPASVRNSLVVFNMLFAVQGGLDGLYLWGAQTLPAGLSYADYAHRGAYPLIGAALLAGGFALLARPHLGSGRALRMLLGLWLLQTVGLVVASVARLDLYVEVYGLTYLRFWAYVWMGLVGAGLGLVGAQVALDRSNGWLVGRVCLLAICVLYSACFVNAAERIAEENLARAERGERTDPIYLCALGPMAARAFLRHEVRTGERRCLSAQASAAEPVDWREWGFRRARVRAYLVKAEAAREKANDL